MFVNNGLRSCPDFILIEDEQDWNAHQRATNDEEVISSIQLLETFPDYKNKIGCKPYNITVEEIVLNPQHFPQLYRRNWQYGIGYFYVPCTLNYAICSAEDNLNRTKERLKLEETNLKIDTQILDCIKGLAERGVK